jgi:tRNA pseudouridine38-40 synthase
MRIKITVAYLGTAYAGWQRQANAPSVQAAIEAAVASVEGQPVVLYGAGRTDTGVHARGQVAHFDSAKPLAPDAWRGAINAHLEPAIRVMAAAAADADFHARHSAGGKTYRYQLDTGQVGSPFHAATAWHVGPDVDIAALRSGACSLLGPLDQRAFATRPQPGGRPDRPLEAADVLHSGDIVDITIRGHSFLSHAVRGMVGTLVQAARGRRTAESIRAAAESGDREMAGPAAPAHGLCLDAVHYPSLDNIGDDDEPSPRD